MPSYFSPIFTLAVLLSLTACDNYSASHRGFSKLEQIRHDGVIHVLTRKTPTTFYETQQETAGLEYELVMLFADYLNVRVNFIFPNTFDNILTAIVADKADIAAAGLTVTQKRQKVMRFAPAYQSITEQLVYRSDRLKPKKIADLNKGILEVTKGTSHTETLRKLKKNHPQLDWNETATLNTDALMYLVNEGLIDYTVADSHQVSIIRRYYPKLSVAFDLTKPRQLAWALPQSKDNSLYHEVVRFFQKIKKNRSLDHLLEKYYGNTNNLNYVGNCTFRLHIESRLPKYINLFKREAKKHNVDWRLLAAIGYQESHWNPNAISPTGVKGLMMLTQATAKQLAIKDRTIPEQSIKGGALYFKQRLKKIPARIQEPDRTWFALASYNVGFGHLEDARVLTQRLRKNPDEWLDVKTVLPLLSEERWYKQTKHGYARGREPVRYVENIRSYYDLLIWLTEEDKIEQQVMKVTPKKDNTVKNQALSIIPSVL